MSGCSLVLLPGLDGTGVLFGPLIARLPARIEPIVVSYSGRKRLAYGELLPRVLAALPSGRPFFILGESFSGPLAVMAADRRPPGLRGIIFSASFVQNPRRIPAGILCTMAHPLAFGAYARLSTAKALLWGYSTPGLRRQFSLAMREVEADVLASRVRQAVRVDVRDELARCKLPILYIRGTRDFVVPGRNARQIQHIAGHVTVAAISAPHMVLQTQPQKAAAAISHFIEGALQA